MVCLSFTCGCTSSLKNNQGTLADGSRLSVSFARRVAVGGWTGRRRSPVTPEGWRCLFLFPATLAGLARHTQAAELLLLLLLLFLLLLLLLLPRHTGGLALFLQRLRDWHGASRQQSCCCCCCCCCC